MVAKFSSPINFSKVTNFNVALERFRKALEVWLNTYITTLGTWQDWTPTLTNLTLGNGTMTARYTQIGKVVYGYFKFTLGSTSTVGTAPQITFPVTLGSAVGNLVGWPANLLDTGTLVYRGHLRPTSTTQGIFYVDNAAGTYLNENNITATVPMTWTTGDAIVAAFWYEVA